MTKSRLYIKQKCLPSILSNITNNKNELGKAVRLVSFSKRTIAIHFNLQICPSIPTFVFVMLFKPSFYVLSGYYIPLSLVAVPTV